MPVASRDMSVFQCVLYAYLRVLDVLSHPACTYPLESTCAGKSAQYFQITSLWMSSLCILPHPSVYVWHFAQTLDYTGRL